MARTHDTSLVEVFQCASRRPTDHRKLRFILQEGKKFFIMTPKALNCNSIRLRCHRDRCRVTLSLKFLGKIKTETEIDLETGKSLRRSRKFALDTDEKVLMSTSSYTVEKHKVSSQWSTFYSLNQTWAYSLLCRYCRRNKHFLRILSPQFSSNSLQILWSRGPIKKVENHSRWKASIFNFEWSDISERHAKWHFEYFSPHSRKYTRRVSSGTHR